jgi:hypothetical protein
MIEDFSVFAQKFNRLVEQIREVRGLFFEAGKVYGRHGGQVSGTKCQVLQIYLTPDT